MGVYVSHEVLGCFSNHALALKVTHKDFSKIESKEKKHRLLLA